MMEYKAVGQLSPGGNRTPASKFDRIVSLLMSANGVAARVNSSNTHTPKLHISPALDARLCIQTSGAFQR